MLTLLLNHSPSVWMSANALVKKCSKYLMTTTSIHSLSFAIYLKKSITRMIQSTGKKTKSSRALYRRAAKTRYKRRVYTYMYILTNHLPRRVHRF